MIGASLLILLTLLLGACDLSDREPEPPDNQGRLVTLSDPDSVLVQIDVGWVDGIITSYMNAFTPDFVFHPDALDSLTLVVQNPGVFDNWTYDVERQVMQFVLHQSGRTIAFSRCPACSTGGDIVVIYEDYDLTVGAENYQGQAEFHMRLDTGEWRIFQWIDRRRQGSDLGSWSLLKGENR